MKKYNYKEEIMFFLWDDYTVVNFGNKISNYFENKHNIKVECSGKDKDYINIKFIMADNYVITNFKYDESLFYNCYKHDGIYECEKYIGTRAIIHKLWYYLFDYFLIITKKEPLLCNKCGKPTGIIFNDYEADEKSVGAGGCDGDDLMKLYDYSGGGINKCYKCGEYFCDDCTYDSHGFYGSYSSFTCDNCEDGKFDNYNCDGNCDDCDYDDKCHYEENTIDRWGNCKFDDSDKNKPNCCEECEFYSECLSNAEDNRDGYESFCDIVSDAYGSVDAFWECNGI